MTRRICDHWGLVLGLISSASAGCAIMPPNANGPTGMAPAIVPGVLTEADWESTVDTLHRFHFSIAQENRLAGTIETDYLTGAGLFEPWHLDSVTLADRLESSLQPIRRRAVVRLTPQQGGTRVTVEVIKERENPRGPVRHDPGVASYPDQRPVQRDLDVVLSGSTPPGWITLGRDLALERQLQAAILARIGR